MTEAIIYLKDGKRKYGMLIEEVVADTYQFISNSNYSLFKKSNNPEYIESMNRAEIETIDTSLK